MQVLNFAAKNIPQYKPAQDHEQKKDDPRHTELPKKELKGDHTDILRQNDK